MNGTAGGSPPTYVMDPYKVMGGISQGYAQKAIF